MHQKVLQQVISHSILSKQQPVVPDFGTAALSALP
jgi:hypothetical protein